MTEKEFETLASAIKASYPASKVLADASAMKFWYEMLKDIDFLVAQNAFQEFASTSTYPPTIAEIRKLCMERCQPSIPSFDEAWELVQMAISLYGSQNPQMAFGAMDNLTLSVVRNLGWTRLCQSENQVADRANFREAYEAKAKALYRSTLLPGFVAREKALLTKKYIPVVEAKEIPQIEHTEPAVVVREELTDEQWIKRAESLERMRRSLSGEAE